MGIQGLLQALKPHSVPVHVSKYAGQRVGIDAYSWLHKGAYGCAWHLENSNIRLSYGGKLPPYVLYCMSRIKMLQYNNVTPVVVFDGGRLPLKAITETNRRRTRDENLQKAHQKLAEGDSLGAQECFQKAVEITPLLAHDLVKALREERIEYVVAPYEADAQLAHLARLGPEEGGVATIITEDSDMLAYGCKVVLFKMDKYGNGEEHSLERILNSHPPPAAGISFRTFDQDLFLAMCVLAGCDFLPSIPGIGVKRAHSLLTKYRNVQRVLDRLKFEKHAEFPEDYITHFWQAKAIFTHARVYDKETGRLKFLNPIPDELLDEFDGDTEFLGPDLPRSRAAAIAEGRLDPTTMESFSALPRTPSPGRKNPEPVRMSVRENLWISQMEPPDSSPFSISQSLQAGSGRLTQRLPTTGGSHVCDGDLFAVDAEAEVDVVLDSQSAVTSVSPPAIDQKLLAELQSIAFAGRHEERASNATADNEQNCAIGQDLNPPNNNPFKQQKVGDSAAPSQVSSSRTRGLEDKAADAQKGIPDSGLISPTVESQAASCPDEWATELSTAMPSESGRVPVPCRFRSSVSPGPVRGRLDTIVQKGVHRMEEEVLMVWPTTPGRDCQPSQLSTNSPILADISPNVLAAFDSSTSKTSKWTPSTRRNPSQGDGKIMSAKSTTRSSGLDRSRLGGKRSRSDALPRTIGTAHSGSILRFFKPVSIPSELTDDF